MPQCTYIATYCMACFKNRSMTHEHCKKYSQATINLSSNQLALPLPSTSKQVIVHSRQQMKIQFWQKKENQSNLRDSLNRLDSPFRVYLLRGAWLGGCLHV